LGKPARTAAALKLPASTTSANKAMSFKSRIIVPFTEQSFCYFVIYLRRTGV
jgi:hypothetical protein